MSYLNQEKWQLLLGGEFLDSSSGTTFTTYNPATEEPIASVAKASSSELSTAVDTANQSLAGKWGRLSAAQRGRILFKAAEAIRAQAADLAKLETANCGKALWSATAEVGVAADTFEFFAGAASKWCGETLPTQSSLFCYTLQEPVGVCGQIIPWNYPLMMAAWKLAPALAAGCPVILKPAPATPLTALALGKILMDSGLPEGALSILTSDEDALGEEIVQHPGIHKIAFTGSTETGKKVAACAAQSLKRVTLELGGKSPNVVFADADLSSAVDNALFAIFYSAGQSCEARSRILVEQPAYDRFLEEFSARARSVTVGDPMAKETKIGSLISKSHWERVHGYVTLAREEGGEILVGGDRPEGLRKGHFYAPTVITGLPNSARSNQEEIFGPVCSIQPFADDAEAAFLANDSRYGLAATIYTRDFGRAHRLAREIRAGTVSINTPFTAMPGIPFGGFKESGYGREQAMRSMGLYSESKSIIAYIGAKPIHLWSG